MSKRAYQTILYSQDKGVVRITFNRPEVHNAFNSVMISELDDVIEKIQADD